MSQSLCRRMGACCLKSSFKDIAAPRQLVRRTLVTVQERPKERLKVSEELPPQYWPQLPPRMRPDHAKRQIIVHPPPPSERERCKEPIKVIEAQELARLDPTGARTRLFDRANKDRPMPGDILLVTFKSGEPFSGVIISIKGSGPLKAVLMRNQLTGIGMEMSVKVHSPDVQSMEIVQRAAKRARRAKLTYLRKPEHDMGSVQRIVDQYLRERAKLTGKKVVSTTGKRKGRR